MLLKADRVAERIDKKNKEDSPIIITPQPNLEAYAKTGAVSIDLRLGTWFVSMRAINTSHLRIEKEINQPQLVKSHYVKFGDSFFFSYW